MSDGVSLLGGRRAVIETDCWCWSQHNGNLNHARAFEILAGLRRSSRVDFLDNQFPAGRSKGPEPYPEFEF